jgi:thiamine-phosphate pyrophosphorylase
MLKGADVAAVLLSLAAAADDTVVDRAKTLAAAVQRHGAALLLDGRVDLVAQVGADGAHLRGFNAFSTAAAALKPDRIAGCGGLATRHDAMLAAEAGADYVMFGEPDTLGRRPSLAAIVERVSWWAEVFEVPCVGYAGALDEIEPMAVAGADFVGIGSWLFEDGRDPAVAIAEVARRLAALEAVA